MVKFKLYFDFISNQQEQNDLFDRLIFEKEHQTSGYYNLPYDHRAIEDSINYMKHNDDIIRSLKYIVIIGIGGSSLGLKAIDTMLYHLSNRNGISIKFLEHTDPLKIQKSLDKVELKNTLFIVISKSGMTIETTSLMKYCINRYNLLESSNKKRLLVITDLDSLLDKWAKSQDIYSIKIDGNIGGRFSVLSSVGITPLMLLGYNVDFILKGARNFQDSFLRRSEEHILQKALFIANSNSTMPMNILFSYSSSFRDFNYWYVQLWGESLGKINKDSKKMGLTPISLIGSIDQHSFLQLILEGKRDKTITFLGINKDKYNDIVIPNVELSGLDSTNFVNNIPFSRLLATQQLATMSVLQEEGIPTDSIQLDLLNEENVGSLIMYYELLTSSVGCIFNINTYNQPAVERGKRFLYKMLS